MRLPRKGILIRLLIYVPLLGFFGWQALDRYLERRNEDDESVQRRKAMEELLEQQSQSITMPDGTVRKVPVITPEQAKELWGIETPPLEKEGAAEDPSAARPNSAPSDPQDPNPR